jgi:hypothetical protein
MRRAIKLLKVAAVAAFLFEAAACGSRKTISPDFGSSNREAFKAQIADQSDPAAKRAERAARGERAMGLDPDEARVVYENYRASLSSEAAKDDEALPSVLIVEDPRASKKKSTK